jgi:hypothetical protein
MTKRLLGLLLVGVWIGMGGIAHAALTIDTNPIALGNVDVGQFAIGSGMLSASPSVNIKLELGATGCGEFQILTTSPLDVGGPAGNQQLSVQLSPTSAGAKSCAVLAKDNATSLLLLTVTVTATAVSPPTPLISVAPTGPVQFADTEVGATSSDQSVTATNVGNSPLIISSATFSSGAGDYTLVSGVGGVTLQPNDSTIWKIACRPSAKDTRNGTFRIASNSGSVSTNTDVALTCKGLQGLPSTSAPSHNFGDVLQGATQSFNVTLTNTGNISIDNITATFSDTTKGYVFDVTTLPTTLAANGSKNLTVRFAPQSGDDGGLVTLTFGATYGTTNRTSPTAVLSLDGNGLGVSFAATSPVDFASFRFDARPQLTFPIMNTGEAPLAINSVTFAPDNGTVGSEVVSVIRKAGTIVPLPQTLAIGQ